MKNLYLVGIFTFLCFQISVAQYNYEKKWKKVERLELEGKAKAANKIVQKIYTKAEKEQNTAQIVKSFIYSSKFSLLLDEEAERLVFERLEVALQQQSFPTNAILENIYANFLFQYFKKHQYKIRARSAIENDSLPSDYRVWDAKMFIAKIHQHFQHSIQKETALQQLPSTNYTAFLKGTASKKEQRPTLYDILAHTALDFYDGKVSSLSANQYDKINKDILFTVDASFLTYNFVATSSNEISVVSALQLFQKLEKLHQNSTEAYIPVVLKRLEFAIWKSKTPLLPLYLKALKKLANRYQEHTQAALIQYDIANSYLSISSGISHEMYPNYKEFRVKAHKLTQEVLDKYPNSEGALKCELLQKDIEKSSIRLQMEAHSIPNRPSLASVSFRNIDTLFLKAYRVPNRFLYTAKHKDHDSIIASYALTHKPVLTKNYVHKIPQDFYAHDFEISVPKLPTGNYLITLSDKNEDSADSKVFVYSEVKKTNLAIFTTTLNSDIMYTVVNRDTGIPIHNAKITVFDDKKIINQHLHTDYIGNAIIRKREGKRKITEYVTYQNDTLYTKNTSLGINNKKEVGEEATEWKARPFVFMDRSIYRPGQTIYFKGILLQQKNGKSSVVPNVYCSVIIEADYDEMKEFRLKTNEFGTFSGSFRLPKNAPTGEYSIEIDEDIDFEEDEHPFWDFVDFESHQHEFRVEEYKRPRFEVVLDKFEDHVTFNDSIHIKGTAKALLGSYVSDAIVKYKVKRQTNILYNKRETYGYYSSNYELLTATTKTDKTGKFTIPFVALENDSIAKADIKSYTYTIDIDIIDINGETQTAQKTIQVSEDNFNFYLVVPTTQDLKSPLVIGINANDVNNVPVLASGDIKIYKLKSPDRVLRERPWSLPTTQLIPKAAFITQFPHEQYEKSESERHWEKGTQVAQLAFNTTNDKSISVDVDTWKSGKYAIESYGINEQKDSIHVKKIITLTDIEDRYLPDNEIFDYTILNSAFAKDGYIALKIATAIKNDTLPVNVHMFYQEGLVYAKNFKIDKGSKIVQIPIKPTYKDEVTIRLQYTKFNSFYERKFNLQLFSENKFLNIETLSFRNKLMPGQKETWRFNILDLEKKANPTEVLASMYDESLDQFTTHVWNPNMSSINYNYYSTPRFKTSNFTTSKSRILYNKNVYLNKPNFGPQLQFDWFGLDFKNSTYKNNLYLKRLQEKKEQRKNATGNITGYVSDDTGLPLPGATVLIKGTEIGITTDFDGLFSINVKPEEILVVSYIGFNSEEIRVGSKNNINVSLESNNALGEVVIVAYGTERRSNITSSIVTINGRSINIPTASIEQILRGQAAGIDIQTSNGQSGGSGTILLRGRNSIDGSVAPLFIIDGVPIDENTFKNLDQNNITSLDVLKGDSATALYGNRGANGVIIITTKYGTKKETIDGVDVIVGITEDDLNTVETRKKLDETAFFFPHLRTDAEGNVAIEFEVPEALTRWKFQLLAHQKDGVYGMIEKNAVTQKELMVIPNMPRFLREKDTIVISTKVTNLRSEKSKGIASLRLFNALNMKSIDAQLHLENKNKAFTIDAKGNTTVSWKLYIPEGLDAIQYRVIAKAGNFSDGEESALPVLKNSILITEAKPIWVKAGEATEVTFSKLANNKSKSLKQHKLTLEYTSNPTWNAIQSLPYLLEYPYECAEQTFARLYANLLATHILQSSPKIIEVFESWKANGALISDLEKNSELKTLLIQETPWVRDAASETEKKQRLLQLFDADALENQFMEIVIKLDDLQKSSGGFPWFSGGNENIYMTLHILNSYAHLQKLNVEALENRSFNFMIKKAVNYIDEQFFKTYIHHSKNPANVYYEGQIQYLHVRSSFAQEFKPSKDVQKAIAFYTKGLENNWLTLSIEKKAQLATALHRFGNTNIAKKIMTSLAETAVTSEENGMYWKAVTERRSYTSHAVEVQALLIEAFSEITKDDKIVGELQLWLLQQKQTSQWATTKATTEAIYALLLHPKEFISIKDNTVFTIGTEKIKTKQLNEAEKEAGTGYLKMSWNKDETTKEKATIKIQNNSKTVGYGGVYWQYFEELDNIIQNDESPLQVTKELYTKKVVGSKKTLVPLAKRSLQIGDLITVRLTIKNKKDIEFIHLKDMRAAGLEPTNVLSEYKWQDGVGYFESTRDASTNFFFDKIPAGVFILEYEVRVNNVGDFSNGITTIESMYAPEFRSHTKGIRIKVK
ncbi:MG2 domain-containing protein [Kordia sp.]|uniref:alpha-2-macroglobulin family protein n=1 Tax=Kordia sp. TaxID=1965332 RepID=UPI003D2E4C8D